MKASDQRVKARIAEAWERYRNASRAIPRGFSYSKWVEEDDRLWRIYRAEEIDILKGADK